MIKALLVISVLFASTVLAQTNGCSTGASNLLDGSPQSYALCSPLIIDGRNKGGWIALNRAEDQSNSELQCYNPGNVFIQNGFLTIISDAIGRTCHYYPAGAGSAAVTASYTSGFVQWNTFSFTYGDLQVRARGPANGAGNGGLPAIWLLGANCIYTSKLSADNFTFGGTGGIPTKTCAWSASGSEEIDIFEQNTTTTSNCHFYNGSGDQNSGKSYTISDPSLAFHIYELQWAAGTLTWLYDGSVMSSCSLTLTTPTLPMFLQINNALVSGITGANLPTNMQVDWVKVCQPSPCSGNGGNVIFYDDFVPPVAATLIRPQARLARFAGQTISGGAVMIFRADSDEPKKRYTGASQ